MRMKRMGVYVIIIYAVCYFFRIVEYFGLRTDQTIIGEAFLHKLVGILVILFVMKRCNYKLPDIGIQKKGWIRYTLYGLLLGLSMFAIGYTTEIMILKAQNNFSSIRFFVSSYAVDHNVVLANGVLFLMICIAGNIINVMMEEGLFRGLFQRMLGDRFSFIKTAILCSLLFGLWHIIGPIRNYIDGISSLNGMIANVIMLFCTSSLIAFKFAMLSKLEGALYMGMADHFVNNTIVNLLHVVSQTGTDEMMFARISIAQSISFILVLVVFIRKQKGQDIRR